MYYAPIQVRVCRNTGPRLGFGGANAYPGHMAACAGCGRDNPAGARFCMQCGAGLGALCPHCSSELASGARFCAFCGQPVTPEPSPPEPVEMIKLVTILFADVVGSTAQAELMHPEDTRALMAEFFDAMSEEIRAEGGTVERIIGDAIMADFGVPVAREDDPVRAVRAARRMLERLEKFNTDRDDRSQISIRIGINTGEVSTGGSFGEQLLVMGDAVNVAARLEQAAEVGSILIGERTARAVRDYFRLEELNALRAKGKSEALTAFRVVAETPTLDDPAAAFTVPLVGRNGEMRKLENVFASVGTEKAPHLVALLGDPGVGKSRLTRDFMDAISDRAKIVFGRCLPYGNGVTFWPLREILSQEAGVTTSDSSADVRGKLAAFAEDVLDASQGERASTLLRACYATMGVQSASSDAGAPDPRETFRHLLEGWRDLLRHFSAQRPLVVVIEDIHWADATMLEVLGDLVRHVKGPVMFICPARPDLIDTRPEWLGSLPNLTSIHLDPLDDEESCRFIALLLDVDELPEDFTQKVLERAEGNPFFLEEILNRLMDEGYFAFREGRWEPVRDFSDVEIPDNVQAAILARLDLLSTEDRAALQLAGVIGRTFWPALLSELTKRADISSTLETLRRRNLVVERPSSARQGEADREFAFKHVLTRDVAYESLPRRSRGEAHAAVARWIEKTRGPRASEVADLVAHHYDRGYGWLGDEELRRKARSYYVVASLNELLRFAVAQAERLGCRAVELSEPGVEKVEALEALGDLYFLSSAGDNAWKTFTDALHEGLATIPRNDESVARIAAKAAIIPTRWEGDMGVFVSGEEIDAVIADGLAATGETDSRDKALLLISRALLQAVGYREKDRFGKSAALDALAMAERLGDANLASAALDAACVWALFEARYGEADRVNRRRLELVSKLDDVREIADVYGVCAFTCAYIGRYAEAERFATSSLESSRNVDPNSYLHALMWRVQARFMKGDWAGAWEDQHEIERFHKEGGEPPSGSTMRAYGVAFFLSELMGDEQRADRYRNIVRAYKETAADATPTAAGPLAFPARALVHQGLAEEARGWLRLEESLVRGVHMEAMCEVLADLEEWDAARDFIPLAREQVQLGEMLGLQFFVDRLEGRMASALGDAGQAAAALASSANGFANLRAPWEEAWSRLLLGELLLGEGDTAEAVTALATAQRAFQALGSVRERDRCAILQSSLGIPPNPSGRAYLK